MRRPGPLAARLGAVLAVLVLAIWLARPGDEAGAPEAIDQNAVDTGEPRLEGRGTAEVEPPPQERSAPIEPPSRPLPFLPLDPERSRDGVRVSGRVLRAGTDAPVAGATVMAWTHEQKQRTCEAATTDAEGAFTLDPVASRQHVWIVASTPGLHPSAVGVTLTDDEDDVVIHVGAGGALEGRVTQADGTPAVGADVWLVRPGVPLPPRREPRQWFIGGDPEQVRRFYFPRAVTDENGRFVFRGVPLEVDRLPVVRLSSIADVPGETVRFAFDGETLTCDVAVPVLVTLTVRVLDAEGGVVAGVQVDLESTRIWFDASDEGEASADGATTVEGLVPGAWKIRAWLPDAGRVERDIVLAPGAHETVVIQAPSGLTVEGQVVDARGDPVAGARLWLSGPASRSAHADHEGRFRLTGLPAGPGSLEVSYGYIGSAIAREKAGLPPVERTRPLAPVTVLDVMPGGPPLRIVLPDGGRIQGTFRGLEAGTKIEVRHLSRQETGHGTHHVSKDGVYRCDAQWPGDPCLLLFTTADGRTCLCAVPALAAGEDHDLGEIALEPGVDLAGRVVGAQGEAIENARVRLTQRWTERESRTDASGTFRFAGLPREPVWARVDARGYPPAYRVLDARTGAAKEIRLSQGGILELSVLDVDGAQVKEGTFSIGWKVPSDYDADHDGLRDFYRLDPSGTTRLRCEAATYLLSASTASHDRYVQGVEATVRAGETTTLEVRLKRTGR